MRKKVILLISGIFVVLCLLLVLFLYLHDFPNRYGQTKTQRDVQQTLLAPKKKYVPAEAKKRRDQLIQSATATNQIAITDCHADPLVIKVPLKQDITVKNNDNTQHTLFFFGKSYVLPPKGQTILTNIVKQKAVYTYSCDDQKMITGTIYIY